MLEVEFEIATHIPILIAGILTGAASFGVLMLALVPVLRHTSEASMAKGFLAIAASFAVLVLGIILTHVLAPAALIVLLCGELAAFFAGWIILACALIARK